MAGEEEAVCSQGKGVTARDEDGMTPDERRIQELEEELRALKMRQRADEGAASVKKKVSASEDNCGGDGYDGPVIGIPEGQAWWERRVWELNRQQNSQQGGNVFSTHCDMLSAV